MPAMSKAQIREREEKALKKWKKKGGKTTKLPTRTARGAATPPSSSSRSGKGPMGSGGRLDPQGSVRSYTHPKVTAPSGGKLPVPLKVVKKAVETGTLDDLYAALGKKAGQLRKWFKTYTGAAIKPSRKSSKEASERSGVKPITGRKPSRKPSKEASERKNVKPIKRNKALVTSGKKDVPGPGPKVPPAIRSKPQPGTSKIPRSGIKPPSQSGKPKPLPLAIKPKAAIPPITSGDDKGKGRGTHTPYSVKKGDTLSQIAHSKGTTLKALLAANNIAAKDANKLRVGQKLVLPGTVKDRKSVYQGMTKSQMAAMHMPKNKKTAPKMTDPTWGKAKPKVDDFAKMPKPKKKHTSPSQEARERKNVKPIKKKPEKFLGMFEIDPPEGGRKVDLPFGLSYKTISDAQRKKEFPMGDDHHKRGGQIKGYKKGGKVKKVRKASRPRGVGIALRGWGKAMR